MASGSDDGEAEKMRQHGAVQAASSRRDHADPVWLEGKIKQPVPFPGRSLSHWAGNSIISNYKDITILNQGSPICQKEHKRSSVPGGKTLMASSHSGYEQEAAEFIEYLTSKEVNSKYNQNHCL